MHEPVTLLLKRFSLSHEQSKSHKENKILWVPVRTNNFYVLYPAMYIIIVHYILNTVTLTLDILLNDFLSFHRPRELFLVTERIIGFAYDVINMPAHSSELEFHCPILLQSD